MKKLLNPVYIFAFFYFIFASFNLTVIPIFNDESIYLDWADRSVNVPGMLYYSIYDGKTPFQLWLFGISEKFFQDPLFAGRIVSVVLGALTIAGLYLLSSKFADKRTAVFVSIFYLFTPIIFFYNRQALMESGVAAAGVWGVYFFLEYLKTKKPKYIVLTGIVLGLGFFIKTNSILFLIAISVVEIYRNLKKKDKTVLMGLGYIWLCFFAAISLLLINPEFWSSLSMNSRYAFTPLELLHFPIINWLTNIYSNISILFIFMTPFIFILTVAGGYLFFKKDKTLFLLILLPVIFQTLLVKAPTQRYIVSFIPLLLIFVGYTINKIYLKNKILGVFILTVSIILPALFVLMQIFSPKSYFSSTKPYSNATETYYVSGHLSGYGINRLIQKLESTGYKQVLVTFASNTGNPESTINIYFKNKKNIQAGYIESSYFGPELKKYECIKDKEGRPIYFISRSNYFAGLENYLKLVEKIQIPGSADFIGLYIMREGCSPDKTLMVDPVFNP